VAYVVLTVRAMLVGVFLISAFGKVRGAERFSAFTESVRRLGGLPRRLARIGALGVVVAEAATVVLLVVPGVETAGLALAGALLCGFAVVLVVALRRGATEPCRCFGVSEEPIAPQHVARNVLLAGCAIGGAVLVPGTRDISLAPGAVALCLLVAVVAAGAVVLLNDVIALVR
jgi:hypothetical protein